MNTKDQKAKILDFLKTEMLGVVSTIDSVNNKPESAVVGFSQTPDLEVIFGTENDTRKFKNIVSNPAVSFVIGWNQITVQYEGVAKVLEGEELDKYRTLHVEKNPFSKRFAFGEKQRFLKVTPTWIRFSDLGNPDGNFEVEF